MTRLIFSRWVKFDHRRELKATQFPGIYAIAISTSDIAGARFSWMEEIVYFGFTNGVGGLRVRLEQFNNTLRDKAGPGHGGAQRFRGKYRNGNALAKKLYVAIDLSPFFHPVASRARASFEPCWLGGATGWGTEARKRSDPSRCLAGSLSIA